MKKLLACILSVSLLLLLGAGCQSEPAGESSGDGFSSDISASDTSDVSGDSIGSTAVDTTGTTTGDQDILTDSTTKGNASATTGKSTTTTTKKPGPAVSVPAELLEQQSRWNGRTFQVLNDPEFKYGIKLQPTTHTGTNGGDVMFAQSTEQSPYWLMPQWYSRQSLTGAKAQVNGNTTTYANDCKSATMVRNTDGTYPSITLVCNGFAEYGAIPAEDTYGWVHYGIGQDLRDLVRLSDLESFVLDMDATLNYQEDKSGGASPESNSCQFNLCFILRNDNEASDDYGKIIWCQVCLFDERYDFPPEYCGIDAGIAESSGEFIYTMASKNVLTKPFGDGETAQIDYDWLPTFKKALATVKANGGMSKTEFDDLKVTSFGLGYEMKRGENYSVTLEDMRLEATYTKEAYQNMCPQVGTNYTKGFTDPSDWYISNGEWTFKDGVVTQAKNKLTGYRMTLKSQWYSGNYDIEYEMCSNERYSTVDAWSGISFGKKFMDDDHGGSGDILFTYPSGNTVLGKFQAPEEGHHTSAQIEGFKLKTWYKYKLEVRGNKGTVYVDGKKLFELESDYIAEGGYISVICCLGRASFRNFKVTVK